MKRKVLGVLPGLLATFALAFLPACGFPFRELLGPRVERGPIERPHVVERIAPRDADIPAEIERGAFVDFSGAVNAAALVLLLGVLVVGGLVCLAILIYHSFD